jgi:hypothetical protein
VGKAGNPASGGDFDGENSWGRRGARLAVGSNRDSGVMIRDQTTDRAENPEPRSFWLRLAKGGALVLVGALAHLWLPSMVPSGAGVSVEIEQEQEPEPGAAGEVLALDTSRLSVDAAETNAALLLPLAAAAEADAALAGPEQERRPLSERPAGRAESGPGQLLPVGTRGVKAPPVVPGTSAAAGEIKPAPAAERDAEATESIALPSEVGPWMDAPMALPVALSHATFVREVPPAGAPPLATSRKVLAAAAPVRLPAQEERIQQVLQAYRTAFEQLDAAAAKSVWPTVDVRALGYAFSQLAGQRLTFESCGISVSGDAASARCRGQAEYLPKVGGRRALVTSGEWVFNLARRETDWQIVAANVK